MSKKGWIRHVFFDLDGTLIDTEPSAAIAVAECFRGWGIELDPGDTHYITGRTWAAAFHYLFHKYSLPIKQDAAAAAMMEAYRQEIERELRTVPGAVEAVKSLAAVYPLALVTGSNRREAEWALKKLGIMDYFKTVLCAEDYTQGKPSREPYLKALRILDADPKTTLVFEDSAAGIASGLAAGLQVVAISCTNHSGQNTSGARWTIPDLSNVDPAWIASLSE